MWDVGTRGTHGGSHVGATAHLPPFPNTRGQVLTQGLGDMVWLWAFTPLGRELVTQVALLCAMWDGITPGCWGHFTPCVGTAPSCLRPLLPPHGQGWHHTQGWYHT